MTSTGPYKITQGMDVLAPRATQAYAIPCDEWNDIKAKLTRLSYEPWLFHTLGSALLGASLSTLIALMTGAVADDAAGHNHIAAVAVIAACTVCGGACIYFAHKERGIHRERAGDIRTAMELLERRYDHTEA